MDVGLAIFLTGDGIHPDVLARAAEDARLRVAVGHRAHAHPGRAPGWSTATAARCRTKYRRTHDPFVALAFAAAATEKLIDRHAASAS